MFSSLSAGLLACPAAICLLSSLLHREAAKADSPKVPAVGILKEAFPAQDHASSPERLRRVLETQGLKVRFLSAEDLADPETVRPDAVSLVVLPYGEFFPLQARDAFLGYLRDGGRFLSLGGYAFQSPLVKKEDAWERADEANKPRPGEEETNLLPNPGFEEELTRWKRTAPEFLSLTEDEAFQGERSAQVRVPQSVERIPHPAFTWDFYPKPGSSYLVRAHLKTENVRGIFAYMAVYQFAEDGALVTFRDFAQAKGTADWKLYAYPFTVAAQTARVQIQLGLYRATGAAWFDGLELRDVSFLQQARINTATGDPGDGLVVGPQQIGVFDPSFPLKDVKRLLPCEDSPFLPEGFAIDGACRGWAASAVRGDTGTRYIPLLKGVDSYGRNRGPAAALLFHHGGYFAGSSWGFVGVDSRDLFGDSGEGDLLLSAMARALLGGAYVADIEALPLLLRDKEPVEVKATVHHPGVGLFRGSLRFFLEDERGQTLEASEALPVSLAPRASASFQHRFPGNLSGKGLTRIRCRLERGGEPWDTAVTGVVRFDPETVASGAKLAFRDNFFHWDGCPLFLAGSDTYSNIFFSRCHNPSTWRRDLVRAKDYGLLVYENLQFVPEGYRFSEEQWDRILALVQLAQEQRLVYMPCLLVGNDVAVGDDQLRRQEEFCRSYADRVKDVPGLILYLNGDLRWEPKIEEDWFQAMWRRFLERRYGNVASLREAWRNPDLSSFEDASFPTHLSGVWRDLRAADRTAFEVETTRRWLDALVRSCRQAGAAQPTTAEFYCDPYGGIDIVAALGTVDVANVGYFREPGEDLRLLPASLKFADRRRKGKSLGLGEFGVKTHPAWTQENGAYGYHLRRTEEEAKELFLAVGHYGFGMGCSKIQNWCLRDAPERVFPWGLFYPSGMVPKETAVLYRNMSLLFRFMRPEYAPLEVTFLLPDRHRLGPRGVEIHRALLESMTALTDLGVSFDVLNEDAFGELPENTKLLWYPLPYCPKDEVCLWVERFVKAGGALYISGDVSFDSWRRRTRSDRLERWTGASFVEERYAPLDWLTCVPAKEVTGQVSMPIEARPGLRLEAGSARVLSQAEGIPWLLENRLGKGRVFFVNDCVELHASEKLASLYGAILKRVHGLPSPAASSMESLHVMAPRVREGTCRILWDRRKEGGRRAVVLRMAGTRISLSLAPQRSGLVWMERSGRVRAVEAAGDVAIQGKAFSRGDLHFAAVTLDGQDLRRAKALWVFPLSQGTLRLEDQKDEWLCQVGEFRDGSWVPLETFHVEEGLVRVTQDRARSLLLLTRDDEEKPWERTCEAILRCQWRKIDGIT